MYSETSLIQHLYNPTFSLIRPLYEVQSPYICKCGKRHSIIQQPPNPTLFSGPIECRIREVSLYVHAYFHSHVISKYVKMNSSSTSFLLKREFAALKCLLGHA